MLRIASLIGLTLITACSSDEPAAPDSTQSHGETLSVVASQVFMVTLQTIGSGEYISPPRISSSAVQFLGVTLGDPLPAGLTQKFRFLAAQSGRAVITFLHDDKGPTVQDTVVVQ
jgi:hypothetical protein